ncbi:hypothetical protein BDY19DRAFT_989214 [Irpex rosettiformis]|uniref:Uncharacterized protein n=1 Tax=Irpex rosettiformis TaxID=378272 RepID=A0ACB8UH93_9APHY|nr:hypothetical protein BDY19DRAFT_989214 [Irpex rosettiformis]
MSTPLRASFSEPISLFTSLVHKLSNSCEPTLPSSVAYHAAGTEYDTLKAALQSQLGTLATFAQSAAKEALALSERIGSFALDVSANPTVSFRQHQNARPNALLHTTERYTVGLAKRTEQFATLIFDTDRPRGEGVENVIKRKNRQLWDIFDEKESIRMELEAVNAKRNEANVKELEAANEVLTRENKRLAESKEATEEVLRKTRIEANAWKSLAENVQEMQEMAISAFERCNALERENAELRDAMHAFAEGSTSYTIQQLQKIIASLTEEVSRFKKRECVLKEKEVSLRGKEDHSIIKAMRKQTRELKRRSLQNKNTENTVLVNIENRSTGDHNTALPPVRSFSEFFLI